MLFSGLYTCAMALAQHTHTMYAQEYPCQTAHNIPALRDHKPQATSGTCTHMYIPALRFTRIHIIKNKFNNKCKKISKDVKMYKILSPLLVKQWLLSKLWKKYFGFVYYFVHFMCMGICLMCWMYYKHVVAPEAIRRHQKPWNWSYHNMSCHVNAGMWAGVL